MMARPSLIWASRLIIVLAAASSLGAGEAFAQAQGLAAVGPVDPGNGFPQFYQDQAGQAVEQCLDNVTPGDPCGILALGGLPNPTAPIVFPTNFPGESFFWLTSARFLSVGGNTKFRADLTMALEATFGNAAGAVVSGDQI